MQNKIKEIKMNKQKNKNKKLWPLIVISFAIVFMIGAVVQHLSKDDYDSKLASNIVSTEVVENVVRVADIEPVAKETPAVEKEEIDSFANAFAKARDELGGNQIFEWNGMEYTTSYANEIQKSKQELIEIPDEKELTSTLEQVKETLAESNELVELEVAENNEVDQSTE
jgi:hypothetical protein